MEQTNTSSKLRFGFGENWQSYVDTSVSSERIAFAIASLQRLLKLDNLRGKTFLDIGCGSGLFSLAACLLEAERVVSFDYDQNSVNASLSLRAKARVDEARWTIAQGSVLDAAFMSMLPTADIVYSWGVLHHTGSMWSAIDQAASRLNPGGRMAIAIYNNVERRLGGSWMWWQIKRFYNRSPRAMQRMIEYGYAANLLLLSLSAFRNPIAFVRDYGSGSGRGMSFWHDIRDWVGGFPYEYATAGQIFNYVHDKHQLQLEYLNTHDGHLCNEFLFRRGS